MEHADWDMIIRKVNIEASPYFHALQQTPRRLLWRLIKREQRWKYRTVHDFEPFEVCDALSTIEYLILLESMSDCEGKVLILTIIHQFTEREVGTLLGYSKSRIHDIKASAIKKLRSDLYG